MTRMSLRTCEHRDLNDTEEPNGARSTCSCPHRRASTFEGLSACFRGRFALADTSMDCGHRCTDLRSIAGNQRYRLLAEWKYRGSVYPHQAHSRAKRAACTRVTHVQRTIGPMKYLGAVRFLFGPSVFDPELKWRKHVLRTVAEIRCYICRIRKHIFNTEVYKLLLLT